MEIKNGPYVKDINKYDQLVDQVYKENPPITLPPEYAMFIKGNMLQFLVRLARYKFVAKMLHKEDTVLEIGSGSGLGANFLAQHCKFVRGLEVKSHEIEEAKSLTRRDNVEFIDADFFDHKPRVAYDAIVNLDVIEHMDEASGRKFIAKSAQILKKEGVLIVGSPSIYSYPYQSPLSQAAHIKCYDLNELSNMIRDYYGRVFSFSMNDEIVHTGNPKMAWYNFVLACAPKG